MTKTNKKNELTQAVQFADLRSWARAKLKFDIKARCINAYEVISEKEMLIQSYLSMKSNPGNMTKGIDKETLDGINQEWFESTAKKMKDCSFQPRPARRVYIPKKNGKLRPLGISSARDKIIQQALMTVLEIVLEPRFSNHSHGFRPNRGCHSALKQIRE